MSCSTSATCSWPELYNPHAIILCSNHAIAFNYSWRIAPRADSSLVLVVVPPTYPTDPTISRAATLWIVLLGVLGLVTVGQFEELSKELLRDDPSSGCVQSALVSS